jgi:3-hydroxybutyryl-CoA dehydrogenase
MAHVAKMIETQVAKGRLAADAGQAGLDRIGLARDPTVLAEANVIIQAIVERLDVKQALFAGLDAMTGPDTIIVSACQVRAPSRVRHALSQPRAADAARGNHPRPEDRGLGERGPSSLARRMAREPVLCTDSLAFLVGHVGRAFVPEAQRLLSEGRGAA